MVNFGGKKTLPNLKLIINLHAKVLVTKFLTLISFRCISTLYTNVFSTKHISPKFFTTQVFTINDIMLQYK